LQNSLLPPERASLSESGLATGGLAQDGRASSADDDGLGVREDGGDGEATGALDVHEEGARSRHKSLLRRIISMSASRSVLGRVFGSKLSGRSHLELVLAGLSLRAGVEEIDRENL